MRRPGCAFLFLLVWPLAATALWKKKLDERGKHWSFSTPQRPPLPDLKTTHPDFWARHGARVRTGVDAFVFAKLIEKGLEPAPNADRRTLVRRAYFDLLGLPPAPEE